MNDHKNLSGQLISAVRRRGKIRKERYELARRLGFTGTESAVLQNWSEERIRVLAEERKGVSSVSIEGG